MGHSPGQELDRGSEQRRTRFPVRVTSRFPGAVTSGRGDVSYGRSVFRRDVAQRQTLRNSGQTNGSTSHGAGKPCLGRPSPLFDPAGGRPTFRALSKNNFYFPLNATI